jgi:hypothetical protein
MNLCTVQPSSKCQIPYQFFGAWVVPKNPSWSETVICFVTN